VRVRDDFAAAVFVDAAQHRWSASPTPGVERMMLERIGTEDAVATSLVRYAPGTRFPFHVHGLGEEFLVLDGDFRDAAGCYRTGRYLRHPPGTSHAPWSVDGCLLFVKLKQFAADDGALVDRDLGPFDAPAGLARTALHRHRDERVELIDAPAGAVLREPATEQIHELLVLEGAVVVDEHPLGRLGWARLPSAAPLGVRFVRPSRVWLKVRAVEVDRATAAQGRMNA